MGTYKGIISVYDKNSSGNNLKEACLTLFIDDPTENEINFRVGLINIMGDAVFIPMLFRTEDDRNKMMVKILSSLEGACTIRDFSIINSPTHPFHIGLVLFSNSHRIEICQIN